MRNSFLAATLVFTTIGLSFFTGCDLLNRNVLIDQGEKTYIQDSTTIRVMSSVPDSTQLVLDTSADWTANVSRGGDWCTISKTEGKKGKDTLFIHVAENTETSARQTTIVVESGTNVLAFKVTQKGAEAWLDTPYWHRTNTQRMGLHGTVKKITQSDNRHGMESSIYEFDEKGNLLVHQTVDKNANRYDTTRTYDYDEVNHRIRCTVKADVTGEVARKWLYEYGNLGKLVAYSANGWTDQDPLAEDMEGWIVPDLSAAKKSWYEDSIEFHEDKTFNFENDTRLLIVTDLWKVLDGVRVEIKCDTMRVSYQYYNSCRLSLPQTSRDNVTNTTYYENGMVKMLRTNSYSYDFLENVQRMVVVSYEYTGPQEAEHEIDSYECVYNENRDIKERKVYYHGESGVTVESYPQYQYDDYHNWNTRVEEVWRPGLSEPIQNATKREILYYKSI